MSSTDVLMQRNKKFAEEYEGAKLTPLPKMRSVILTCIDARVDPAHVLGLELGDSVVIRNNGGRVTQSTLAEIAALAFFVRQGEGGGEPGKFEIILMQHTQCGAQRMADPAFQAAIKSAIGVDVSEFAIHDHTTDLTADIEKLRADPAIPDYVTVSAFLLDLQTGLAREVIPPHRLR